MKDNGYVEKYSSDKSEETERQLLLSFMCNIICFVGTTHVCTTGMTLERLEILWETIN